MTTFPNSPRILKAGLALVDPDSGRMLRMISLQYNPDSLSRTLQVQGAGGEGGGERAQPFRLKGAAIESFKLDAELDATDQLEFPNRNPNAAELGIAPQLAALEALINPTTAELLSIDADIDAADQLEFPDQNPCRRAAALVARRVGIADTLPNAER